MSDDENDGRRSAWVRTGCQGGFDAGWDAGVAWARETIAKTMLAHADSERDGDGDETWASTLLRDTIEGVVAPGWTTDEIRDAIEEQHPIFGHKLTADLAAKLRADAEAPGLSPEDLDFRFEGGTMVVTGKSKDIP